MSKRGIRIRLSAAFLLLFFCTACTGIKEAAKPEEPGSLARITPAGSVGNRELETASRPMILNLIQALKKQDLALFNRDLIPEIKFQQERFSAVCKSFNAQNGDFVNCAYLGYLDRGNVKIVLWKSKFRFPGANAMAPLQGDHLYILYLGKLQNEWKIFTFQTMEKF